MYAIESVMGSATANVIGSVMGIGLEVTWMVMKAQLSLSIPCHSPELEIAQ